MIIAIWVLKNMGNLKSDQKGVFLCVCVWEGTAVSENTLQWTELPSWIRKGTEVLCPIWRMEIHGASHSGQLHRHQTCSSRDSQMLVGHVRVMSADSAPGPRDPMEKSGVRTQVVPEGISHEIPISRSGNFWNKWSLFVIQSPAQFLNVFLPNSPRFN